MALFHRLQTTVPANLWGSAAGPAPDVGVATMSHVETPLVKKLSTFVRLLPEEVACLAELQSRRRTVAPLTEIVHEGQTDHRAWILQEGWANCYKLVPNGGRQIISFPLPGDFMGLRSVLLQTSDHSF